MCCNEGDLELLLWPAGRPTIGQILNLSATAAHAHDYATDDFSSGMSKLPSTVLKPETQTTGCNTGGTCRAAGQLQIQQTHLFRWTNTEHL
jgi:hypothetical protein